MEFLQDFLVCLLSMLFGFCDGISVRDCKREIEGVAQFEAQFEKRIVKAIPVEERS